MPHPLIVVMAKAPRADDVKIRLIPPLTKQQAATLAACFIRDTVLNAKQLVDDVMIAYFPSNARTDLEAIFPSGVLWFEQQGSNLGERLESVATHVSGLGFRPFIIMGSDSPTLPVALLEEALEALLYGRADVSLGPTEDGGYYLVGLNVIVTGLFKNINWSTPFAYGQTVANAASLNLRLHASPTWYDIDTPTDLSRLRDEIFCGDEIARKRAPNTYRWFMDHALSSSELLSS